MTAARALPHLVLAVATALAVTACASTSPTSEVPSTAAPSMDENVTVTTTYGGEDTVPFNPQRVVVLDYAVLDTLDALGLADRVVGFPGGTPAPAYLAHFADSAQSVGDLFEFDTEAINALDPDLIIIGGRSYDQEEAMEEIAPTLNITFDWGSEAFLASLQQNTLALGEVFDVEDQAVTILEELQASAHDVAAQAADDGPGLVVLTSGGELAAYGPDPEGRYDFVYNVLGVTPAAEQVAIDTHGDVISYEFLAQTNPSLLIVLDRDSAIGTEGASAKELLDNPLVNGTDAVKDGNVVYVDTAKWYLAFGGLTALETMISEVDSIVE